MIKKNIALYTLLPSVKIAEKKIHYAILIVASLLINVLFLYFYDPAVYYTMTQLHGQLGYNLARHSTLCLNTALTNEIETLQSQQHQLIDFDQISLDQQVFESAPFPIHDPIGYGVLLGLLWRLTGSYKFYDVQLLQIVIFIWMMLFLYAALSCLAAFSSRALLSSLLLLTYLPIIAMNIQPARDCWAFYGIIILFYVTATMWKKSLSWSALVGAGIFFALCQWMRPTISTALMVFSILNLVYGWYRNWFVAAVRLVCIMWLMNILCFWLPFCAYNRATYGRYMVGPFGQNLLEGLGEFTNPWGYQLSDPWIASYIYKKYGYQHGTVAFDDAAKKEFWQAVREQPWFYIKSLIKRLPQLIVPPLQWLMLESSPYRDAQTNGQKIMLLMMSPRLWIDFLVRWVYIKLFLLLGYAGFVLLAYHRRWEELLLIAIIVMSGWATFPSHIECRYLTPFYWVFVLGISYFFSVMWSRERSL